MKLLKHIGQYYTLIGMLFIACSTPEVVEEYQLDSKKCSSGKIQLLSDSTYYQKCEKSEDRGTWFFKSDVDSILCLRKDKTNVSTIDVTRNYFVQNDSLFELEQFEIIEEFEWIFGKDGPSWTRSIPLESKDRNSWRMNETQIISSVDSNVWINVFKGKNGNFHLKLSGYYFIEDQPGISAGGAEYEAKAFLALEKQKK